MRFAKFVFIGAGIWGIVVIAPLYFLLDISGQEYVFPASYPHFFYGFLVVTTAWQISLRRRGARIAAAEARMEPTPVVY